MSNKLPDDSELTPLPADDELTPIEPADNLGVSDSPLRKAMAAQPNAEVVTVDTPDGPAQFNRKGQRVLTDDEAKANFDAADQRVKTAGLTRLASAFNSGGLNLPPYVLGAAEAVKRQLSPGVTRESLMESFRKSKDAEQATVDAADKEAGLGWQLAGKAPAMMVGGPATVLGRVGLNAGTSAVEGFLRSPAKVEEEGGLKQSLADTGTAGLFGAGASLAGEAVAAPLSTGAKWLANKSTVNAGQVAADEMRRLAAKAQSLKGSAGSAGGETSRAVDAVKEVLQDPNSTQAELVMAQRIAQSEEFKQAVARQRLNAMAKFFGAESDTRMFGQMASEAATDIPGKAAPGIAAKLDPANAAGDLASKAWKSWGQRALITGGAAALGHLTGFDGGTAAGAFAGLSLSSPGGLQFMRNALKNPAYASIAQRWASNAVNAGAGAVQTAAPLAGRELGQEANRAIQPTAPKEQADEDAIRAWLDAGL